MYVPHDIPISEETRKPIEIPCSICWGIAAHALTHRDGVETPLTRQPWLAMVVKHGEHPNVLTILELKKDIS